VLFLEDQDAVLVDRAAQLVDLGGSGGVDVEAGDR
jgi:hypothetical protein